MSWDREMAGGGLVRAVARFIAFLSVMLLMLAPFADVVPKPAHAEDLGQHVDAIRVVGVINSIQARYVDRAIEQAEADGAQALIIQMDTPGGLDTSMREIMQRIMGARVPVVVYVAPSGARAASAGLFITMSSHVAAMAPSTNIGSAHPVSISPGQKQSEPDPVMTDKVVNDAVAAIRAVATERGRNVEWAEKAVTESVNITSAEAVELKVVDLEAKDMEDLLNQIDGREVMLASGSVTLQTAGATVNWIEMGLFERFLHAISDPNLAYIFFILGLNGIIYELASPGSILPGTVGGICLVLAFLALGTLPINLAGVLLIALAFLLFAVDVFAPTHGALTLAGIIALMLGSMVLVNSSASYLMISPWLIVGVGLFTGAFFAVIVQAVVRSHRRRSVTGREGLVGSIGDARTELNPTGFVYVQGELWSANAEGGTIPQGEKVRVVGMQGLTLLVRAQKQKAG